MYAYIKNTTSHTQTHTFKEFIFPCLACGLKKKNQMATGCVLVTGLIIFSFFLDISIYTLQEARNRESISKGLITATLQ